MHPMIPAARFDPRIRFRHMSASCLLHISQLMDLGAFGVHRIRNGREVMVIRIERWPDGDVYVRRLLEPMSPCLAAGGGPVCVPEN